MKTHLAALSTARPRRHGTVFTSTPAHTQRQGGDTLALEICFLGPQLLRTWGRKRQPTPVFLPGKSRGQRSLQGFRPRGCKEPGGTEQASAASSGAAMPTGEMAHVHFSCEHCIFGFVLCAVHVIISSDSTKGCACLPVSPLVAGGARKQQLSGGLAPPRQKCSGDKRRDT